MRNEIYDNNNNNETRSRPAPLNYLRTSVASARHYPGAVFPVARGAVKAARSSRRPARDLSAVYGILGRDSPGGSLARISFWRTSGHYGGPGPGRGEGRGEGLMKNGTTPSMDGGRRAPGRREAAGNEIGFLRCADALLSAPRRGPLCATRADQYRR